MDPEVKKAWVEALRSGEYEQTDGGLCYDGKYCCLGVLCEIDERVTPIRYSTKDVAYEIGDGPFELGVLPREFRDLIGITPQQESIVIKMNDGGTGFPEIADYIEANL